VSLEDIAEILAKVPTQSTKAMHITDRCTGIHQMLCDLNQLARKDGCIAAAWALEFVSMVAEQEQAKERVGFSLDRMRASYKKRLDELKGK
jgi:hypothetical protein